MRQTAFLVACAAALQAAESLLPHPVPGVRLGLANMVVLIALDRLGFRIALEIAVLRTVLSSLVLGTFLSPAFILSFGSSIVSTVSMGLLYRLTAMCRRPPVSLIGVSVGGAVAHNLTQIALAYVLLLRYRQILLLLPWLGISAVATGWVTGWVAALVCRRLAAGPQGTEAYEWMPESAAGAMAEYGRSGVWKIGATFLLAVLVVVIARADLLLCMLAGLLSLVLAVRMPARILVRRLLLVLPLALGAFLLPTLMVRTGAVWRLGPATFYSEGLAAGGLVVLRLVLLVTASSLLGHVASSEEIVAGLDFLLRPLALVGIRPGRAARVLGAAWQVLPQVLDSSRQLATRVRSRSARVGAWAAMSEGIGSFLGRVESAPDGEGPPADPAAKEEE